MASGAQDREHDENVELKLELSLEQVGTYMRRKKQYLYDFLFVFMLLLMSSYYDELQVSIIDMHIMCIMV